MDLVLFSLEPLKPSELQNIKNNKSYIHNEEMLYKLKTTTLLGIIVSTSYNNDKNTYNRTSQVHILTKSWFTMKNHFKDSHMSVYTSKSNQNKKM